MNQDCSDSSEPYEPKPAGASGGSFVDAEEMSADARVEALLTSYFSRLADAVGLPRSVALIYRILFLSSEPISFQQIVEISGLSKASASTGLRLLERVRGLVVITIPSDRRTFYKAELSIRRLVSGFIEHSLQPTLEAGDRFLAELDGEQERSLSPLHAERFASVREWHRLAREIIPLLSLIDPRISTDPSS
jgi:DNA-binding transcriptional regulator GbsR (MarR family)